MYQIKLSLSSKRNKNQKFIVNEIAHQDVMILTYPEHGNI